jgi:GNAT superfamily N-acetyltransferase
MRYWWVNQNQTYRHEVAGGYLWSPKRNANGARNPFYETMREVAPGDLILSFVDTRLIAIGIARSYCWESPKPTEFGIAGQNWEDVGWRVRVTFTQLLHRVRPKDHIDLLRPLLPARYSPLQINGNGLQSIYLAEIPELLAEVLFGLIGKEVDAIRAASAAVEPIPADDLDTWEVKIERGIEEDASITETNRFALVRARRGQGLFRDRVARIERRCRITGVENPTHLVASHCKPWRECHQRRAVGRREWPSPNSDHRSPLRSWLHRFRGRWTTHPISCRAQALAAAHGDQRDCADKCGIVHERTKDVLRISSSVGSIAVHLALSGFQRRHYTEADIELGWSGPPDTAHVVSAFEGTAALLAAWRSIIRPEHIVRPGRAAALCPCTSDVNLLRDFDCVIDLDAEVANGALNLRVP